MGVSTNGQISYGIILDAYLELPWEDKELADWWMEDICGFKPEQEIYDTDGNLLENISNEDKARYWRSYFDYKEEHQPPVELVNCCSADYPIWIISAPGSIRHCRRGYPIDFNPRDLIVTKAEVKILKDFCKKYLDIDEEPKWYLSSYWG